MFSSNASSAASDANYIEDVFSTWLYTATGPSAGQTIVNNIDLATKGGMLWIKDRTNAGTYPVIVDTVRGANKWIYTSATAAQATSTSSVTSFNTNGFTLGTDNGSGDTNSVNYAYTSPTNMVSWTFREQPKFFDVVTWTGDGQTFRTVNHNLGAKPGFIICKCTSTTSDWSVLAKMSGGGDDDFIPLNLNSTAASRYGSGLTVAVSSTLFYTADLGFDGASNDLLRYNQNGATYVAYLFAHNAGGFGLTGTDNVISCGSYTGNGSTTGPIINLGYEPQWVLIKNATDTGFNWSITDNMRGFTANSSGGTTVQLFPNTSGAEANFFYAQPQATGFQVTDTSGIVNGSGFTYIYIAIRRGPMKVPTTGTSVFEPVIYNGTGGTANIATSSGFVTDMSMIKNRNVGNSYSAWVGSRLIGNDRMLATAATSAENTNAGGMEFNSVQRGVTLGSYAEINSSGNPFVEWGFSRAPSVFDVVCYTGTGVARTVAHNLAAVPELMIVKGRSSVGYDWAVYSAATGNNQRLFLNLTDASVVNSATWNNTTPTSSVFSLGNSGTVNGSGITFVAYLFSTCPGVSKVGSYTGNGSAQNINCGFTGGARFLLIKRTDSTGDWWVWDSARGIISGNDPYTALNSTYADITGIDDVDPLSSGFTVNQISGSTSINVSGGSYVYLAIA